MNNILIYLKTTETCNLNCKHCFTSGTSGRKIYFNHTQTIDWLKRLSNQVTTQNTHIEFHGGEPFLAPLDHMQAVYDECKTAWPNMSWGATTNLVFKLTPEIIAFIQGPLGNRIATSWDPDIRFATTKQYLLWHNNVKQLIDLGVEVKLFVSLTKSVTDTEPIELLKYVHGLGISEMSIERLTYNGSANQHPEIFPSNLEQDAWFLKMHHQIKEHNARDWFDNEFMESVYAKFETGFTGGGTFCRDCEEKLFTVNADGTLAGCPNSAPEDHYAHITDSIDSLLNNPNRLHAIACERNRDPRCYECPVFQFCGGDCRQLAWEDDVCGAPKSLMLELGQLNTKKTWILKEI